MTNAIECLNELSVSWQHLVWHSSWQSGLLALLVVSVLLFGKKLSSPVRYSLLMVALIKFAVPPFLATPIGAFSALPQTTAVMETEAIVLPSDSLQLASRSDREFGRNSFSTPSESPSFNGVSTQAAISKTGPTGALSQRQPADMSRAIVTTAGSETDSHAAVSPLSSMESAGIRSGQGLIWPTLVTWMMLIHIAGSAVLFWVLIDKFRRLSGLRRRARPIENPVTLKAFGFACDELGFRSMPSLFQSPEITTPVSFGCSHPTVILPTNLLELRPYALLLCRMSWPIFDDWIRGQTGFKMRC